MIILRNLTTVIVNLTFYLSACNILIKKAIIGLQNNQLHPSHLSNIIIKLVQTIAGRLIESASTTLLWLTLL